MGERKRRRARLYGDDGPMAEKLRERLLKIGVDLIEFYPARGYWAQTAQDVLLWTGRAKIPGVDRLVHVGCWESATECGRQGIRPEITPAHRSCSGYFEIAAIPRKKKRTAT